MHEFAAWRSSLVRGDGVLQGCDGRPHVVEFGPELGHLRC